MKNLVFVAACGLSLQLLGSCGNSQNHPGPSSLRSDEWQPSLGSGVNFSETKTYRTCITQLDVEESPLALSRLYKETRIQSKQDMLKNLSISGSVGAKGLWGNAHFSLSYFNDLEVHDDAFYWLVDANYAVTDEKIKSSDQLQLSDYAKDILETEGLEAFYNACGTHFYSGKQIGARYTLVYEVNSKEDRVVESLKARGNFSGFGMQAGANFSKFLQMAEQASILKVHSRIIGGSERINNYVKDPQKMEEELQNLRDELMHQKKGVVLRWYTTSYDIFVEVLKKKRQEAFKSVDDGFRNEALATYFSLYTDNNQHIATLLKLLVESRVSEPQYLYSLANQQKITEIVRQLRQQNHDIRTRATACLRGENNCPSEDLIPIVFEIPDPDKNFTALSSWKLTPMVGEDEGAYAKISMTGKPGASFKSRVFDSSGSLFASADSAFYKLSQPNGRVDYVPVGTLNVVIDPVSGLKRPAICVGEFAKSCNLRLVENPKIVLDDGYPNTKLILTIFDEQGFIKGRSQYLIAL